ncbi:MAG: VWA domain-containing protein, partial [Acetobacteraceae bacterium]|nr:VWA domain-containing protein [Acetobacteraceae bacterium]
GRPGGLGAEGILVMRRALLLLIPLLLGLIGDVAAQTAPRPGQPPAARMPLTIEGRATLYQRVILRPGAVLAERPDPAARSQPTPGFGVFYVYARQGGADGWIEIGPALDGRAVGWVRAERAIDWRHNLVVAFTNPGGRERAMFFRDAETPRALWRDIRGGAAEAARLREAASRNEDGPVIALEPETHVDITRQFYLLPILGAQLLENEAGNQARLLEVISAPAAQPRTALADPEALRNYRGAVVFVIDTTVSMAPYIDRTREAVRRIVTRIRDTAVRDNFRFGMVAYRDHMGGNPRLEYVTQLVALPDFAAAPDAVLERLARVQEAPVSNEGFDEDALAGIKLALDEVGCGGFGGRFLVLITDAGTREANDPLSKTGLGVAEVRQLAQTEALQVAMLAVHLRTLEGRANHARAERQYRTLTRRPDGTELYYPVPNGDVQQFGETVDQLSDWVLGQVAAVTGRSIGGIRPPQTEAQRRMAEQLESVGTAMRLAYLGRTRAQAAPDVVRSFVLDRDIADPRPERRPLDVRVLLSRNQLSDLRDTVRLIVEAQAAARLAPEEFFGRVRAAAAATFRDPRRMREFQRLGGAFGEYLADLPYQSQVAEITPEIWADMPPSERTELRNRLERLLRLYEELNALPLWTSFDGGRNPNEAVYPVPLDALP